MSEQLIFLDRIEAIDHQAKRLAWIPMARPATIAKAIRATSEHITRLSRRGGNRFEVTERKIFNGLYDASSADYVKDERTRLNHLKCLLGD